MSNTSLNILIPPTEWFNVNAAAGIPAGTILDVQNIGFQQIEYSFSDTQPVNSAPNSAYRILERAEHVVTPAGSATLWCYSGVEASINVDTVVNADAAGKLANGGLSVSTLFPITQISAQYGILADVSSSVVSSGTASTADSNFICSSGTSVGGRAAITTKRSAIYRSGQGLRAAISAAFSQGVDGNNQGAGLFNYGNGLTFGFLGTEFGIFYVSYGVAEIQKLTITGGATSSADIVIDGVTYPVTTTSNDPNENAYDIATQLNAQVESYLITSNGNAVMARGEYALASGVFDFISGTPTITASWSEVAAGVAPDQIFYPQAEWNRNASLWLDPTKGNVYSIQFEYLGYGGVDFYVKHPETGDDVLVHYIGYANQNDKPVVSNPDFNCGWLSWNFTAATDVVVKGASAGMFIEGDKVKDVRRNSLTAQAVGIGATATSILIIRNATTFRGISNLIEVLPQSLTIDVQANKPMFIDIILNPVFDAPVIFDYFNEAGSVVEFSRQNVGVSGGDSFDATTVFQDREFKLNTDYRNEEVLEPGEVIVIAARTSSGSAGDVQLSFVWQEDY